MIGSCIIDTVDLAAHGIFIERGGSDDFLSFPERRTPDQNDWTEYDGLDVDLSDCYFDAKRVKVNYVIVAENESTFKSHLNSFETLHFAPGLRQIYVREFNRTFSLRFVGFPDYKHKGGLFNPRKKIGKITVEYSMDNPLQLFIDAVASPVSARQNSAFIEINQIDLSRFGIVVRDAYSTTLLPKSAKRWLERKIDTAHGITADTDVPPKKQSRQIVIECTMLADSLTEFWANYTALFNNLRVTVPVQLGVTRAGTVLNCYYSKMTNFKKETPFGRKIKVSFNLVLQEIGELLALMLLFTQDDKMLITQDGYAIDLSF